LWQNGSWGNIGDASFINAPILAKNKAKAHDPEMRQTENGNQWCVSPTQVSDL
jgi:hypothetical protein